MPRLCARREKAAFAASRDTGRGTHPHPHPHPPNILTSRPLTTRCEAAKAAFPALRKASPFTAGQPGRNSATAFPCHCPDSTPCNDYALWARGAALYGLLPLACVTRGDHAALPGLRPGLSISGAALVRARPAVVGLTLAGLTRGERPVAGAPALAGGGGVSRRRRRPPGRPGLRLACAWTRLGQVRTVPFLTRPPGLADRMNER
jgi:hypothetical protein